jgi:hypothetical protein
MLLGPHLLPLGLDAQHIICRGSVLLPLITPCTSTGVAHTGGRVRGTVPLGMHPSDHHLSAWAPLLTQVHLLVEVLEPDVRLIAPTAAMLGNTPVSREEA